MLLFAFALPWLTWWQATLCALAAFAFNWMVLPRLLGHRLTSAREDVSDRGVLFYPLVVLALILVFHRDLALAMVGWGFLALGDALAGVAGMKWGRARLPWNPRKSWAGLAGGFFGALFAGAGMVMFATVAPEFAHPLRAAQLGALLLFAVAAVGGGAAIYAFVESAPLAVDDNLVAPILGALVVATFGAWAAGPTPHSPATVATMWGLALAVNGACAALAAWKRVLTPAGIAGAFALGMVTWVFGGVRLWLVLLTFLVIGTAVTKVGWRRKAELGIAERDEGRRGLGNVASKGAVVFVMALLMPFAARDLPIVMAVAALAAALADTAGSEIGKAFGRTAYTLPRLRRVAPGTDGAVSVAGSLATVLGAVAVAAVAVALSLVGLRLGVLAGLVGVIAAFLESSFARDRTNDEINLTLSLVAAAIAGGLTVMLGW